MERIGRTLDNLETGQSTPNSLIIKDTEPTIEEKRESLRKELGVSSLENTFDNFSPVKGTAKALTAFKELAYGKTDRVMLLCYGGVGNGKTHLSEATAIAMYKRGLFVRVMTMSNMMITLKSYIKNKEPPTFDWLLSSYCVADRLIIDDIDGTQWEFEQLEKIVRLRYHERLFTIFTTNLDISELPGRILSRFLDPEVGSVVLNSGSDYRRGGKRSR